MIMTTIILIIGSVVFTALIIIGFLFLLKEHESEPLTPEQTKEIRENYERKQKEFYCYNDDFLLGSTHDAGEGTYFTTNYDFSPGDISNPLL